MKREDFALALNALLPGCDPEAADRWTEFAAECVDHELFVYFIPVECQRQFEIVRKRRRNFVVFRRGGNKTKRFLAQKECSRFAVSDA